MPQNTVAIIGAGPAGLAAAHELLKHDVRPLILEQRGQVGGLARTEIYKGYRFDIGGHRFYTKVDEVQRIWEDMLGEDFQKVSRLSRIYYQGRFYNYPLELMNTLANLGMFESLRILASYVYRQAWPTREEHTFEDWVTNRFGGRLYQSFFKSYTEKVWGIPCHQIQAEWAAQRIKGLSLKSAVIDALLKNNGIKSLINEFYYPAGGPGMMWEHVQAFVEQRGGRVHLNCPVMHIRHGHGRVSHLIIEQGEDSRTLEVDQVISSMPIGHLITRLDPLPPADVIAAAQCLKYRAFILVGLIIDQAELFPDNWIYIHNPAVHVGRIQNFKNWSAAMVPDANRTSLGMEYFCSEGDAIWDMPDAELKALAAREVDLLRLADPADIEDGVVIRQLKAYPVYDGEYREHLKVIRAYLSAFDNLQTIGRNGMHRYNNQDHSMLTGILAACNVMGERHDLWAVNTERSYYETMTTNREGPCASQGKAGKVFEGTLRYNTEEAPRPD